MRKVRLPRNKSFEYGSLHPARTSTLNPPTVGDEDTRDAV